MSNTANKLIAFLLCTGAIDPSTGELTDKADSSYVYDGRRFAANEDDKNSAGNVKRYAKRPERE